MANHASAKKSIRKIARQTAINKMNTSSMRTAVKKVEKAIAQNNLDESRSLFVVAQSKLMRNVNKGIIKANTASRKISRLSARIKALVS